MSDFVKPKSLKLCGNVVKNFDSFRREIDTYFAATGCWGKPKEVQVASLLRVMGDDARRLYHQIETDVVDKTVTNVLDALERSCLATKNVVQNQIIFFQCRQEAGESFERYYARLKESIRDCCFGDAEQTLLRTQIVMGIRDQRVQQELTGKNANLEDTLQYCRANDMSENSSGQESTKACSLSFKALRSSNVQNHFNQRMLESVERISLNLMRIRLMGRTGVGSWTRNYAVQLAKDKTSLFAKNIDNFVCCTLISKETSASVVMRNVRQFITGQTNYLLRQGERDFLNVVERDRAQLRPKEYLNLDMILDNVISRRVFKELRVHIYRLLVNEYVTNGSTVLLEENIRYVESKSIQEFTFRKDLMPPDENDLAIILECFKRLEKDYLPVKKLEHLISAFAIILNAVKTRNPDADSLLGADEFLSLIMWSVVKCNARSVELDAAYMCGLSHPTLTSGECGYHLTALRSAVDVLKRYKSLEVDRGCSGSSGDDSGGDGGSTSGVLAAHDTTAVTKPDYPASPRDPSSMLSFPTKLARC